MICNREAPSVEAASIRWAGQVQFVGVAWTGTDEAFQGFIDEHALTFPQISDDAAEVFDRFEVPAQPALVLVAADGTVERLLGAVDDTALDNLLSALVGGAAPSSTVPPSTVPPSTTTSGTGPDGG